MLSLTQKQCEMLKVELSNFLTEENVTKTIEAVDGILSKPKRAKRESKPREEGKMKRPSPASWLFREEKRTDIISEYFSELEKVPGKEVVKKAKELWDGMSVEDQEPWVSKNKSMWSEYYSANGGKSTSPSKTPFNVVVPVEDCDVKEGWKGPYMGKYLAKLANGKKIGVGKFDTLESAQEAAEVLETCGGVTYTKKDGYSLRVGVDPNTEPKEDKESVCWVKENHTLKSPEKKRRSKVVVEEKEDEDENNEILEDVVENELVVEEKKELVVEEKKELVVVEEETEIIPVEKSYELSAVFGSDDDEDEDDDDEDLEVSPWEYKGVNYLLDENSGDIYDYDSQELVGVKKGDKVMMISGGK
jgi:hypothetical protein